MYVFMGGCMDVWMDGWMDGCMDGWMDGWMGTLGNGSKEHAGGH